MGNLKIFEYQGNNVTFEVGGETFVNATQMAKAFGKRPSKWLELPSTREFLDELFKVRDMPNKIPVRKSDRLIRTINGVGTWFHEDVAIEFSRWLSPAFAIWCNDRIKELLTTGSASIKRELPQTYAESLRLLANEVEEKEKAQAQVQHLEQALDVSKQWISIVRASLDLGMKETVFNWRVLKKYSLENGIEIKTAPCPRYGTKKLYHVSVFKKCYPQFYPDGAA